jgi:hypothetical protein
MLRSTPRGEERHSERFLSCLFRLSYATEVTNLKFYHSYDEELELKPTNHLVQSPTALILARITGDGLVTAALQSPVSRCDGLPGFDFLVAVFHDPCNTDIDIDSSLT